MVVGCVRKMDGYGLNVKSSNIFSCIYSVVRFRFARLTSSAGGNLSQRPANIWDLFVTAGSDGPVRDFSALSICELGRTKA